MAVKFDPLTLDHEVKSLRRVFVPKWKEERESVEVARGEASRITLCTRYELLEWRNQCRH